MCGIGGIALFPMERTEVQLEFIRGLVGEIAIENMARGRDATGIATFQKDGSNKVFKTNVRASEFTQLNTYAEFINKNITNETTNILIHTRAGTKGSDKNNDNNHPIVSATTIGVHNGMIYNDDELFASEKLFRQAEVDSEVIFRLLDKYDVNNQLSSKTVAEKLSGVFAVAYIRKDNPFILNYFRDSNPTTFAYVKELNIILLASQKPYLESALEYQRTESQIMYRDEVINPDNILYSEPPRCSIFQFDVSKDNAVDQLMQTPMTFEESYDDYGWYYRSYCDFDRTDTQSQKKEPEIGSIEDVVAFFDMYDLEEYMGDDYYVLLDALDNFGTTKWSEGYSAGRSTLDDEVKVKVEVELAKIEKAKKNTKEVI